MGAQGTLLREFTESLRSLQKQDPILTADFCDTCFKLEPFFDKLGSLFHFAKNELVHKRQTVVAVQNQHQTLVAVFKAEREAGTHMNKHSPARNLHRLAVTLEFILHIFDYLCHDAELPLRQAVTQAYDITLGTLHYWAVRTAVKAGLYSLPSRESFFKQIGETEESGVVGGRDLVHAARDVVDRLHKIFEGCDMPCSDIKFLPSFTEKRS